VQGTLRFRLGSCPPNFNTIGIGDNLCSDTLIVLYASTPISKDLQNHRRVRRLRNGSTGVAESLNDKGSARNRRFDRYRKLSFTNVNLKTD
jgi:hypothetical protein